MNDCFITTDLFPTFFHGLDYIYAEGQIVDIYNSWGNRLSYTSWNTPQTQVSFSFHRGFTGHEHYDRLHVINANARLYDPAIGRFFSPDPFVQAPDFTQNYNRYSYCMNNPVMFSDPTGEVFVIDDIIAAAALGAIINGFTQIVAGNVNNVGDFFIAAGIGALSGAAGFAVGSGVNAAIAGGSFASGFTGTATITSTGFWAGAGTGAASGLTSGFITGTGNSLLAGNSFGQSLQDGWTEGLMGLGSGVVVGGICGGIHAYLNGKNPWTGKPPFFEATLENYPLIYQSDDMNCKNAVLESIEKMNGGTRTQEEFKRLGDLFLKDNPNASLEEYFKHFGFEVKDPAGKNYRSIGNLMKAGHPTVIEENVAGGHTLTIYKIRQWNKGGKISVWLADPARGIWKTRWSNIADSSFNHGLYTFILSL